MDGHGQWEVVLYNPLEKQTVLYNRYDHSLRILDGRAYSPAHHGPIPMPAPPRRSSIDYIGSSASTTTAHSNLSSSAPMVRQKVELGISPSTTPAFPQAAGSGHNDRCPLCRQHLPAYYHHDHRTTHGSPPGPRRYVSSSYFDLIDLRRGSTRATASSSRDDDDDPRSSASSSSSDEDSEPSSNSSSSSDEDDYDNPRDQGLDARRDQPLPPRPPRARRQRVQSLRSRAFNQGYYHKFFDEEVCLGRGAFGSVHLCHHVLGEVNLGKYAVKKVPVGNDHPRLAAVLKEVKALERLSHPNIVSYKHSWLERTKPADFGPDNIPTLFILTEYANGGNLHDFIFYNPDRIQSDNRARAKRANFEKRATLNPLTNTTTARTYFLDNTTIWSFFTDICNGLAHLHHRGIIHCDLKPQNLLLDKCADTVTQKETTRVLITDFGSVKSLLQGDRTPRTGNTGTIAYMAPEALITDSSGRYLYDYDAKSDVWSLGVILYELCFSESPFRNAHSTEDLEREIIGSTRGITEFPSTPLPRPPVFMWLIQWMMQGDPHKRPTVDDILALPEVMLHNTGTPRPPSPTEAPPPLSTAHLLELPPQIVQTTIPSTSSSSSSTSSSTSSRPSASSTLYRRRSSQLMPPPLAPARPLHSSAPASPSTASLSDDASSSSSSGASGGSGPVLASSSSSSSSSSPSFPSASTLLQSLRLPSPVVAFLAPAVTFCLDHLDALMRQSLFALLLLVKLALCVEMAHAWAAWYLHAMVGLSLAVMLLCLPVGRHVGSVQVGCIVGQWLLAVLWWWWQASSSAAAAAAVDVAGDGPRAGPQQVEVEEVPPAHTGAGLVWELLVVMLIELMLSLLFTTLKLAKADQSAQRWARRRRAAHRR